MNNKGQALVLFVLLLPLVTLFVMYLTEIANINLAKKEIDSNSKEAIWYALSNLNDDDVLMKTQNLIDSNVNADNTVMIDNGVVIIRVKAKTKNMFSKIFGVTSIDIKHTGYIDNGRKIIE